MFEGLDKRVVGSFWLFGECICQPHPLIQPCIHFCTLHIPADTINQASLTTSSM